jgi:SAM-dependent methyltransferase
MGRSRRLIGRSLLEWIGELAQFRTYKNMSDAIAFFMEVHQDLPREGPGSFASTQKAFSMLSGLPQTPRILDIGCGPGQQTLDLLRLTRGTIVAIDNHLPYINKLIMRSQAEGFAERIDARCQDMFDLDFGREGFDLIWAEGAIYILGFERGLSEWKRWLNHPGYMAVTELTWLTSKPSPEIQNFWQANYPAMQTIEENLQTIKRAGYETIGYFCLPESDWWDDYYTPLESRVHLLQEKYAAQPEALEILRSEQQEIDLYRKYSHEYGYVFYVVSPKA